MKLSAFNSGYLQRNSQNQTCGLCESKYRLSIGKNNTGTSRFSSCSVLFCLTFVSGFFLGGGVLTLLFVCFVCSFVFYFRSALNIWCLVKPHGMNLPIFM